VTRNRKFIPVLKVSLRAVGASIIIAAAMAGTLMTAMANHGSPHSLHVRVEGAKPGQGQIVASLFNAKSTYLKQPYAEKTVAVDAQGRALLDFHNLGNTDYAVSIFYDEDMDGKLDTNFLGIPMEKTGFSNGAKPGMGAASWEQAKFTLSPESNLQIILIGKAGKK